MEIHYIVYVRPKYKTRIRAKGAAGEHKCRKGESVISRVSLYRNLNELYVENSLEIHQFPIATVKVGNNLIQTKPKFAENSPIFFSCVWLYIGNC